MLAERTSSPCKALSPKNSPLVNVRMNFSDVDDVEDEDDESVVNDGKGVIDVIFIF